MGEDARLFCEMAMAQDWWRKKLDEYLYELSESLYTSVDGILMQMRPNLATSEYLEIDIATNPMRKVEKLIRSVRSRDLTIFNKFCDILKKSGHESLAEKLRGTMYSTCIVCHAHSSALGWSHAVRGYTCFFLFHSCTYFLM